MGGCCCNPLGGGGAPAPVNLTVDFVVGASPGQELQQTTNIAVPGAKQGSVYAYNAPDGPTDPVCVQVLCNADGTLTATFFFLGSADEGQTITIHATQFLGPFP